MGQVDQWLIEQGEQPQLDWTKLPAQGAFLTCQAPFSMYSGGFGTGKTYALCAKTIALLVFTPNNLGYLARKDGKSLRQTTMLVLLEMLPKSWIGSHNQQAGTLRLTPEMGGSMLIYGDLKDKGDMKNHNLGFFAIDQAEEVTEEDWDFLTGRLRRKTPRLDETTQRRVYHVKGHCVVSGERHVAIGEELTACAFCGEALPPYRDTLVGEDKDPDWELDTYPRFGFGVCNTEDPHHWIYRIFSGLPGPAGEVSEGLPGYQAFSATTYEGLSAGYTDRQYVESLEAKYTRNPLMYERYVLGKWVIAEGLVFPAFNKSHHIFHRESIRHDGRELIPRELPVFEYIDPGTTTTTAVGWVVVEPCDCGCHKHNYYVIEEHYVASAFPEYHAAQIKQYREEIQRHVAGTYMDAAAFAKTQITKVTESNEPRLYSVSQLYIEQGIYASRNQKDWDSGYLRLSEALADDPAHVHPLTGQKGGPHWMVASHCTHWISEILNYKWKKIKGDIRKEEPVDKDDHHMDGSVGFMAGRPEFRLSPPDPVDTRSSHVKSLEDELEELTEAPALAYMRW